MTPDQFETWFDRAHDFFPSVRYFFDHAKDPNQLKRRWADMILPLDYQAARDLLDQMYAGIAEPPSHMSQLPRAMRERLLSRRTRDLDRRPNWCRCLNPACGKRFRMQPRCFFFDDRRWAVEVECPLCDDRGVLLIWSLEAMYAARHSIDQCLPPITPPHQRECVRCHCEKGQRMRWPRLVFDSACMCLTSEPLETFLL
ncbi:hypothetical protein [Bremerella cremea]|uniref:hypothetical protein n=1 Tax=Bremerella cremea TaxID=1031537 RepID=UPI0031EAB6B9